MSQVTLHQNRPMKQQRILGTADLAIGNVLVVIGTPMFGTVALLGSATAPAVVLAVLLFHLPLAIVVSRLARAHPLTGGTYEWVRLSWGEHAGFLMAWITWAFFLVFISAAPLALVTGLGQLLPGWGISPDRLDVLVLGVVLYFALLIALTLFGLREIRGLQWLAGTGLLLLVLLLGVRLVNTAATGRWPTQQWPAMNLTDLAIFLKFAVFGLAGLECMALLGGEIRRPQEQLPRAIALAVPIIVLAYVIGGLAVAVLVPQGEIDLVNPVAQVLGADGTAAAVVVLSVLMLRDVAQSCLGFAVASRLPMVAGWHRMLPAWVARQNRFGVAPGAVLVSAGAGMFLALWAVSDASRQEAYQWLLSAAGVLFGLTYMVIFMLPLCAARKLGLSVPWWLRLAALSGLTMTAAFVLLAVYPIVDVADPTQYAWRILLVVALLVLPGVLLAWSGMRRVRTKPCPDRPHSG